MTHGTNSRSSRQDPARMRSGGIISRGICDGPSIIPQNWIDRLLGVTSSFVEKSKTITRSDRSRLGHRSPAEKPKLSDCRALSIQAATTGICLERPDGGHRRGSAGPNIKFHHSKLNFKWARSWQEVKCIKTFKRGHTRTIRL